MECLECGKEFRPSGHGKPSKYCSGACKAKAYRRRKKNGGTVSGTPEPRPERAAKTEARPKPAELDRRSFERMMDEPLEDVLRKQRDRLQAAMDDISTPANALAPISRQIIAISERLESMSGGGDLFAESDDETESVEVSADAGASIV